MKSSKLILSPLLNRNVNVVDTSIGKVSTVDRAPWQCSVHIKGVAKLDF